MDAPSETILAHVMPELARRVRLVSDALATQNIIIRVTQGMRTFAEQESLWLKGRDVNGNIIDHRAVVTNARPGFSYHNYGLAVDVVPFTNAAQSPIRPDWNIHHPAWQAIVNAAHMQGLTTGATWRTFPDWPHLQLTDPFPAGAPTTELRTYYANNDVKPLWRAITSYLEVTNGNQGNQAG